MNILKYGRENYTVSRIFDLDISEKNSTSNEAKIKKVTVQYIYLNHNEFLSNLLVKSLYARFISLL
jgi:hypothetical protein